MRDWSDHSSITFQSEQLQCLLDALLAKKYSIIGPTVRSDVIVLESISRVGDLPAGLTAIQDKATYQLRPRNDSALFGYAVGPHSWKRYLHVPVLELWNARRDQNGFQIEPNRPSAMKQAFLGVRPCELRAILAQDQVLNGGQSPDPAYAALRENTLIIAVDCAEAGGTCFCGSMGTGPEATAGFDLALTEVIDAGHHFFVARTGTELGTEILASVPHSVSTEADRDAAARGIQRARGQMGRVVDTSRIRDLLIHNPEHPRWGQVATRCLTCGNCTMVCPTCFCTTVEDVTDLTGEQAGRRRVWDSCFTLDFSYIHGGSVRNSAKSRYRQWLTHKFAAWFDQFGQSGCVGCGRCITWCPAGIDVTEEIAALRSDTAAGKRPQLVKETQRGNA